MVQTKRNLAIVIALIVVIAVAGIGIYYLWIPKGPGPAEEIKIGVLEAFSGWAAEFGEDMKKGYELAAKHINERGGVKSLGGAKIKLVFHDITSDAIVAKSEAERLITRENPKIICGSYCSYLCAACAEVTEKYKIPFAMTGVAEYLTQMGWKYSYRTTPPLSSYAVTAVEFFVSVGTKTGYMPRTAAVVYEDSSFGVSLAESYTKELKKVGIEIVLDEPYPSTITDVRPIVIRLKEANPDIAILGSYLGDAILLAREIHAVDFKPWAILGIGAGYTLDDFLALGEPAEYYLNEIHFSPYTEKPYNLAFVNDYKAAYGVTPTETGHCGYITLYATYEVLEFCAKTFPEDPFNPDNFMRALKTIHLTYGPISETYPAGAMAWDENGEQLYSRNGHCIHQVINGKYECVWPEDFKTTDVVYPIP